MSKSYVVNDGGKLRLIGRGKSAIPEGAISEAEAASILLVDPEQVVGEIMSLRSNLDADCRATQISTGEYVFHGGDVCDLANRKAHGEHRRRRQPAPAPAPRPRRRERIELSDPPAPSPQPRRSAAGITVADAAKQAGLSPDEMQARLIGRARLKMIDGELIVSVADLNRLADAGTIPKRSEREKVERMAAEIEGRPGRDSAANARTDRMAEALGMEGDGVSQDVADRAAKVAEQIGVDGIERPDQGEQHKPARRSSGVVTAKATERKPYRLGRPKRWGEH